MSTDAKCAKDLLQTLEDGREGYAKGADELADSDRPELAETFRRFSAQRKQFADEIRALGEEYGDPVDADGSAAAALHRGWMAVKDAVTGSGPESVLKTALQGEDHAVTEYEKSLEEGLSERFQELVRRQLGEIELARGEIRGHLDAASS